MRIIDLYNHAPSTMKLLVKIGATPTNWKRLQEQYRDFIKYGVAQCVKIHHCSTRQPYRARDRMIYNYQISKEDKEKIIQELQGLINLLNQNN